MTRSERERPPGTEQTNSAGLLRPEVQPLPARRRHREVRRRHLHPASSTTRRWPLARTFIDYFVQTAKDYPGKGVEFKRAFADGNHVILHCHQIWPGNLEYAGMDIFRFDDAGRIVEHPAPRQPRCRRYPRAPKSRSRVNARRPAPPCDAPGTTVPDTGAGPRRTLPTSLGCRPVRPARSCCARS